MGLPRPFYSVFGDQPADYVMVLEDLEATGCTFLNRLQPHAEEYGRQLIESLARLHAHFWEDRRFDDALSWVRPAMRGAYGAQLIARARDQFRADFPPVFAALCDPYAEHHERICDIW